MSYPTATPEPDHEPTTAAVARDVEAELVEEAIDAVEEAEFDGALAEAAESLADERLDKAAEDIDAAGRLEGLAELAQDTGNTRAARELRQIEEGLVEEAEELAEQADELNDFAVAAHEAAEVAAAEAIELTAEAIVLDEVADEAEEEVAIEAQLRREAQDAIAVAEAGFGDEVTAITEVEERAIAEELAAEEADPVAEDLEDLVADDEITELTREEDAAATAGDRQEGAPADAVAAALGVDVIDEDTLLEVGGREAERPVSPYDRPGRWFVVHTQSGYEKKVKQNLEARISSMNMEGRIFEVVIPMEDVVEFKGGKKVVVQKKMFPGYLLVRCMMDDDSWYVIRNTPGVTGFVGQGAKPSPLPRRDVESFLQVKTEDEEGEPIRRKGPRLEFELNETVRIKEGPFADFSGQITEINEDQLKVKVEVDIFGRPTPVELEFSQIAKL